MAEITQVTDRFFFGVLPYLCIAVFLVGSWIRFERAQYTWRSGSSELLELRSLVWGSNFFHVGVLALFVGHLVGLLTPTRWYTRLGITVQDHAVLEVVAGGFFGAITLVGATILFWRRITNRSVYRASAWADIAILAILWVQLAVGMVTLPFSWEDHTSGGTLLNSAQWAQRIVSFRPDAWQVLMPVPGVYKAHILLGLAIFALVPFSRLVHIWSAPIWYLGRRLQIVREPYRKRQPGL